MQHEVFLEADALLRVAIMRLIHPAKILLTKPSLQELPSRLKLTNRLLPRLAFVLIKNHNGRMVFAVHTPNPIPNRIASHHMDFYTMHTSDGFNRIVVAPVERSDGGLIGYVEAGIRIDRELDLLIKLRVIMTVVGVLGALVALLAGFLLSKRALAPIARSWQRQREFVADASHEMRTPLAVIQSNLDLVLGHTNESVLDNLEWLNHAQYEVRRLSHLTQDLLTLARADSEQTDIRREPVDVYAIVQQVVEIMEPLALAKNMLMSLQKEGDVYTDGTYRILGDEMRIVQLLMILVDNAIKYTSQGGHIDIDVVRLRKIVQVRVTDTGIGIAKDEQKRIFDRFYRSRAARINPGMGLGLTIASWIVEQHKGKIEVQSEQGKGSVFTIFLPVMP